MLRPSRVLVAGLVVLAAGGAAAFAGGGLVRGAPAPAHLTPPVFAAVGPGPGSGLRIELRSAVTGALITAPVTAGDSWTNNGFALSPDRRYVYYTRIPKARRWNSLLLVRLSISTHQRRLVALGEEPSVSPDGRHLAYARGQNGSATIVVRDLASGRDRSIGVGRLLGGKTDMLHASLAWLGDGTHLAVFEACCPVATSARAAGSGPQLVAVSVPPRGHLSAQLLALPPGTPTAGVIGTDETRRSSLLVSWPIAGDRAAVYRLTFGSSRTTVDRVLTTRRSTPTPGSAAGRRMRKTCRKR